MFMMMVKNGAKTFSDLKEDDILAQPCLYTSFVAACNGLDKNIMPVEVPALKVVLEAKLAEYNENVSAMDLVLFTQAMEHISRISRIIDLPVGNALLVGVGGSGKQSLSKLSAYILGYDVVRIIVSTNYTLADLKTDL
jgi:dynein heavy chain